jgi:hypothetical protein
MVVSYVSQRFGGLNPKRERRPGSRPDASEQSLRIGAERRADAARVYLSAAPADSRTTTLGVRARANGA